MPETAEVQMSDFIRGLASSKYSAAVSTVLEGFPTALGRCGVLSFLKQLLDDQTQLSDLECRLGVEPSKSITPANLAKCVFWELKTQSIAQIVERGELDE